jgi:hypothetical protein
MLYITQIKSIESIMPTANRKCYGRKKHQTSYSRRAKPIFSRILLYFLGNNKWEVTNFALSFYRYTEHLFL